MNLNKDILNCLNPPVPFVPEDAEEKKAKVLKAFNRYHIDCKVMSVSIGRTYTFIELMPDENVRIYDVKDLADEISMDLAFPGARIIAPIPGKVTIGVEMPNAQSQEVRLRELFDSDEFINSETELPFVVGMDVNGKSVIADLAKMPHLLIGGATGQGKSVFLNSLIVSLLGANTPDELKFVLFDPKKTEFPVYRPLANSYLLKIEGIDEPIITDHVDSQIAFNALCAEMDRRYLLLKEAGAKHISEYNKTSVNKLPYIVVVIDEYADFIITLGEDIERHIVRLAQKARAAGIHLVLSTQRSSSDVISGVIKASFPSRVAFRVCCMVDSETILDQSGANNLIGRGDMLFSSNGVVSRLQGGFVDTPEIEAIVKTLSSSHKNSSAQFAIKSDAENSIQMPRTDSASDDPLFKEALDFILTQEHASTSALQRKFGIGYNRAGKIMDQLETAGIVSPARGAQPREILITKTGTSRLSKELLRDFSLDEIEAKLTKVPMLARWFVMKQYREDFNDKSYVKNLIDDELDDEHPLRELIWNHIVNRRYSLDAYIKTIMFGQSEAMAERVAMVTPCLLCDKQTWSVVQEWMLNYLKDEDIQLFDTMYPYSFNREKLTISVPSDQFIDEFENKYLKPWSEVLRIIFGEDIQIFYHVDKNNGPRTSGCL